ncbi:hypothetical protein ACHAC9_12575 [Massilia sp. CMS3.1]|uniref:hypothetical protein n=1 Tax=Massilia sp. CMS3.1 TaxID=3373083 RepID=UPI003EE7CB57
MREPANELWTDLAIFASKALVASPGELDLRHLVPYIFSFVESEVDISRATIMRNILSASYGVDGLDWLYWRRSTQTIKQSPIEQAHWTKNLEPHIAVAILVANGITFDNAKQEVAYQKSLPLTKRRQVSKDRTASKDGRPSTVIEARQIAENFGHQHKQRSALRAVKTYAYWLLYFQDREWLWNWAHDRDMRSAPKWIEPPGINADRVTIRGTSSAFKQHMARARAYARDREWLDDYKKTLRPQKKCRDNKILGALSAVRVQHFAEKSRPIKWTVTLAARRLRIPIPTLNKFIRRNKILGELIPESPHDFRSRLIEWGITECIRQGRKLTASQVQRAALLPGQTPYHIIEAAIERRLRT